MGVLSTQDTFKRAELLNSVFSVEESTETLTSEADVNIINNHQRVKRSQSSVKTSRAPKPQSYIRNTGRKARGSSNSRKFENAVFLSHLIEAEEFSDLNIADFMVKTVSAFEKLFKDQSHMNRWSAFVNLKGEEQDSYLCELSQADPSETTVVNAHGNTNQSNSDLQNAARRFGNVDRKIKSTLKNRNISMSGLKYFEEEMLSVFKDINETVLVSLVPSSMDRLLIHGLCQYMNLTSETVQKKRPPKDELRFVLV